MHPPTQERLHRDQGFSLIETLAVISMVGLLLAMTIPNLLNFTVDQKGKATEVMTILELARSRALASKQDVFVCFPDHSAPRESLAFRGLGIFMSTDLSQESEPVDTRDLMLVEDWFQLPEDMLFGMGSDFDHRMPVETRTVFDDQNNIRSFSYRHGEEILSAEMPYLLFNKWGRVEIPDFQGEPVQVTILKGYYESGTRVIADGNAQRNGQILEISPKSGKVSAVFE